MRRLPFAFLLAALVPLLALAFPVPCALAQEMNSASIEIARPDWRAATESLRAAIGETPGAREALTFTAPALRGPARRRNLARAFPAFVQLSAATDGYFSGIARSAVPVLLPFDTAAFLADRGRNAPNLGAAHYLNGFTRALHFSAGPAGYTAVIELALADSADLPRRVFPRPVEIHITGSLITYNVNDPRGGKGDAVKSLDAQYPGMRRFIREGFVRYAFTRFGVAYVVSIDCLDSTPRRRRLACREAYPIAEKFFKSLTVAGGTPARPRYAAMVMPVERPAALSPDFKFFAPGDIIAGTGFRGNGGHADWTVYSQIRFPLENAPAFASSQSYAIRSDCSAKWRFPLPRANRCKDDKKGLALVEQQSEFYHFPWRDNFCERRDLEVWQCPGGWGHQGQDLRPAHCLKRDGTRCRAGIDAIVAVRDGEILRSPGQEGALVVVNELGEHIRFRHMHMTPADMDADGLVHGRRVREGEMIGKVSNYQDRAGGTSVHLHFDIQVFTRDGWIWVNPYSTLIASYERLIGARGQIWQPQAPVAASSPPHDAPVVNASESPSTSEGASTGD